MEKEDILQLVKLKNSLTFQINFLVQKKHIDLSRNKRSDIIKEIIEEMHEIVKKW
jgi:hypothetical protein